MIHWGPSQIITDGLVLHLDAANPKSYIGTGTEWKDLSGFRNNGNLINGVSYNTSTKGLSFDGVDDNVIIPLSPSINFTSTATNSFTLMVYARVTNLSDNVSKVATVFGRGDILTGGSSFGIGMNATNPLAIWTHRWVVGIRVELDPLLSSISHIMNYTLGTIECIAMTYNHTTSLLSIYRNGILDFTSNVPNVNLSNFDYAMGINRGVPGGDGAWMQGEIYSSMIYNRALTQEEITQNFNAIRGRFNI
jgi:hypothetical protein